MEKGEIAEILKKFGLNEYESRVYTSLVLIGPSKASIIAKDARVPQPKVYGVLDQLMSRQLVEFLDGRPKEFKAISPKIALKNFLIEKHEELEDLTRRIEILSELLKPMKQEKEVLKGVWTTEGKKWKEFNNKVAEMFDRSSNYAYVVSRDFSRATRLAESVKSCHRRNVKIRTISMDEIDETTYYRAKWYYTHGVDIRIFKTKIHPRIILVDGKEVLIRLDQHPTKREGFQFTSLWSSDPSLVKVFDVYLKNLWKRSKLVDFKRIESKIKKISNVMVDESIND